MLSNFDRIIILLTVIFISRVGGMSFHCFFFTLVSYCTYVYACICLYHYQSSQFTMCILHVMFFYDNDSGLPFDLFHGSHLILHNNLILFSNKKFILLIFFIAGKTHSLHPNIFYIKYYNTKRWVHTLVYSHRENFFVYIFVIEMSDRVRYILGKQIKFRTMWESHSNLQR